MASDSIELKLKQNIPLTADLILKFFTSRLQKLVN